MKKFLSIAVASLLAASALVGCGGQGTSSQGGSSSGTPSEDSFKTSRRHHRHRTGLRFRDPGRIP